ncbi:MAG TPA: hypothetical protein VKT70_13875 [Stellaceae bacterium]|nr:hypothetical protein [Stellaceae bacterium]
MIDLSPLVTTVETLLFPALTAILLWLLHRAVSAFETHTGITLDAAQSATLDALIEDGIAFARHTLDTRITGKTSLEVRNSLITTALTYVLPLASDVMSHFGLTEDHVKDLVTAALAKTQAHA